MEKTNHSSNQLPPLSSILKSDITKYQKFINHPEIKNTYKQGFLDAFFTFIDGISSKDPAKQEKILEMPSDYGMKNEFMIYNTIFESFLQVYGDTIVKSQNTSRFEQYQNIIRESEIDFIKQTKSDIAKAIDPQEIYKRYESYIQKYNIWFKEELELIGNKIGFDSKLNINNSLTINDILWLQDNSNQIQLRNEIIIAYLIEHPEICLDFIYQKEKEENKWSQKDTSLENIWSQKDTSLENNEIYNKIIKYLHKKDQLIELNIDKTQPFAIPICNQIDFEERYNALISFIGSSWQNPDLWYITDIKHKTWQIHNIKSYFINKDKQSVSILEYIEEQLTIDNEHKQEWDNENDPEYNENDPEYNENEPDEEEEFTYKSNFSDDDITRADIEMAAGIIWNDIEDSEYQSRVKIINNITQILPKYFRLNIYLGINNEHELPSITIQADTYINEFDDEWNRIKTSKKIDPIIIKPTFCILDNDRSFDDYIQDFINFMDNLSPDYDCLKMLWINLDNDTD